METIIEKNVFFRKLIETDKKLFVNLRMAYLTEEYKIGEIEKKQIENNLESYFDEHILKNDFIGIICEYNGKIISAAYLILSEKPPNPNFINGKTGTLMNVYTYPEYRKKGIAAKLIMEIIKEAKNINVKIINLEATNAGIKLYEKIGFKESEYKSMSIKI
jgi:GNAT superfamily N-acetyltransferase